MVITKKNNYVYYILKMEKEMDIMTLSPVLQVISVVLMSVNAVINRMIMKENINAPIIKKGVLHVSRMCAMTIWMP